MRTKWLRWVPAALLVPLLVSCGGGSSEGGGAQGVGGTNYKDTKSMVLDILKSDEGKKAVLEASHSGTLDGAMQMKLLSTDAGQQIQMAVKDVLTAQETDKFLRKMITDPKFAGDFAKAIQKENKQLQKDLMKDPEYQKQMLELMKNPDYEKLVMDVMKTPPVRQQVMTIMQEALQSPLYRQELMFLMRKVIEEQTSPEQAGKQGEGQKGGGQQGGGQKDQNQKK